MMLECSWSDVKDGKDSKRCSGKRPAGNSKATPLQALPKEISPRHKIECSTFWNLVPSFSWLPQISQNMVGMNIDQHSEGKKS